jgi:proline iminopeptidase
MLGSPASVPVPTWAATGKYDYVIPASLWDRYAAVKGLRVTTFSHSGHTPQLEEPAAFDAEFSRWVGGVSR